jgi:hypothetical protein
MRDFLLVGVELCESGWPMGNDGRKTKRRNAEDAEERGDGVATLLGEGESQELQAGHVQNMA